VSAAIKRYRFMSLVFSSFDKDTTIATHGPNICGFCPDWMDLFGTTVHDEQKVLEPLSAPVPLLLT
jgi:hypothetical protein